MKQQSTEEPLNWSVLYYFINTLSKSWFATGAQMLGHIQGYMYVQIYLTINFVL